ncbi:MAG: hypothetical protein IT258_05360, partial [Saprospiraceae bacterium]|nr:hypothetical protein [Saprospiraceae bacterium]
MKCKCCGITQKHYLSPMNPLKPMTTLWLTLLLPMLAVGQVRHWTEQGVEVYFWDDFDTVYHGPDLYFERVAQPEVASQMETLIGQDAAGFIWLTSRSGYILRFDGLRFEQFPTPRPADNRYHVIDKATNSIWLNTMEGLCCFDMANGQWQLY